MLGCEKHMLNNSQGKGGIRDNYNIYLGIRAKLKSNCTKFKLLDYRQGNIWRKIHFPKFYIINTKSF